jgi:hypothetical protein
VFDPRVAQAGTARHGRRATILARRWCWRSPTRASRRR